jgi:succinate dehydrogenase hydrophobic anchor subunit
MGAAVIILILLVLHMVIMHLDAIFGVLNPAGGHPIEWANVVERSSSTFFMVTYILFLGAALFHGFYGFRNILFELNPANGMKRFITVVLVVGGLGLFAVGTWAIIAGFVNARSA